jgi:hypothetical protein
MQGHQPSVVSRQSMVTLLVASVWLRVSAAFQKETAFPIGPPSHVQRQSGPVIKIKGPSKREPVRTARKTSKSSVFQLAPCYPHDGGNHANHNHVRF